METETTIIVLFASLMIIFMSSGLYIRHKVIRASGNKNLINLGHELLNINFSLSDMQNTFFSILSGGKGNFATINIILTTSGLKQNARFFKWDQLEYFDDNFKGSFMYSSENIIIKIKKQYSFLSSNIYIPKHNQYLDELIKILSKNIPNKQKNKSLSNQIKKHLETK